MTQRKERGVLLFRVVGEIVVRHEWAALIRRRMKFKGEYRRGDGS